MRVPSVPGKYIWRRHFDPLTDGNCAIITLTDTKIQSFLWNDRLDTLDRWTLSLLTDRLLTSLVSSGVYSFSALFSSQQPKKAGRRYVVSCSWGREKSHDEEDRVY